MPKISVIIPVYNVQQYIEQCIDSVLGQSLRDIEVIFVNDASTDSSLAICKRYAERDSRVVVIDLPENRGPGNARNTGMDNASGRYLAFCDSDDAYPANALNALYRAAVAAEAEISGGNVVPVDATMRYRLSSSAPHIMPMWFDAAVTLKEHPALWFPFFHYRYIFSRSFLESRQLRYPDLRRGQDPPFMASALCAAPCVATISDVVYYYRQQAAPKLANAQAIRDYLKHIDMVMGVFRGHGRLLQAHLYLALLTSGMLGFTNLQSMQSDLRREVVDFFLTRTKLAASEGFWDQDYAPYLVDLSPLRKTLAALRRGYPFFIAHKIAARLQIRR